MVPRPPVQDDPHARKEAALSRLWPLVKLEEWGLLEDYLSACRDSFIHKLAYGAATEEEMKVLQRQVRFCDELMGLKESIARKALHSRKPSCVVS